MPPPRTTAPHPYSDLPPRCYWSSGVTARAGVPQDDLYAPKFRLRWRDHIVPLGSCFAQHVTRALRARGFTIPDMEPALPGMSEALARQHGFGLYPVRCGNIYTGRQLLQLVQDAETGTARPEDMFERDGRWFDGLRPGVDRIGFPTRSAALAARQSHLRRVRRMLPTMDVLIFTFGLTETWENADTGTVYPVCPGVIAGRFDPDRHRFRNLTYPEVMADFTALRALLRKIRPDLRILLTVSPVPLAATATGQHVLTATTQSKAVLRAVCGVLADSDPAIAYFPSYEIITGAPARGAFFDDSLRRVTDAGVDTVMQTFFAAHPPPERRSGQNARQGDPPAAGAEDDDLQCEEILLDAAARTGTRAGTRAGTGA